MGANFQHYIMSGERTRKEVIANFCAVWDQARIEYGTDSYSGSFATMARAVSFPTDRVFDHADDAAEFIMDRHDKRNEAMAVKYRDGEKIFWMIGGWCAE